MKNNCPVDEITVLKAGCDRMAITFGNRHANVGEILKRAVREFDDNPSVDIYRNSGSSGYEMLIKVHLPLSVFQVSVGCRRDNARPHKLEFVGSKMSDDDYIMMRRVLVKVFGRHSLDDVYNKGNISSAEFHVDCSGLAAGDILPSNYAQKWGVLGVGSTIETLYWGKKHFKSYNKSKCFKARRLAHQCRDFVASDFIYPVDVINRIERTVHHFKGETKGDGYSPRRLMGDAYSPFDGVEFIDTRRLEGNRHVKSTDLMLLRILGPSSFMALCRSERRVNDLNFLQRLIDASTRTGFGSNTDLMIQASIRRLEFLSPDFIVKEYRAKVAEPQLKYHHLGYVTRELLDFIEYVDDNFVRQKLNEKTRKYLLKEFGSADAAVISGKSISEKSARKLLSCL